MIFKKKQDAAAQQAASGEARPAGKDKVCEQFGWLDKDGAWAACIPAGVYVVVEDTAE